MTILVLLYSSGFVYVVRSRGRLEAVIVNQKDHSVVRVDQGPVTGDPADATSPITFAFALR